MHKEATHVGVRELRANLSGLLRKVRRGATIIVMSRDEVVAELHPPPDIPHRKRKLGVLKGRIRMAPDFDELPADIIDAMENG